MCFINSTVAVVAYSLVSIFVHILCGFDVNNYGSSFLVRRHASLNKSTYGLCNNSACQVLLNTIVSVLHLILIEKLSGMEIREYMNG